MKSRAPAGLQSAQSDEEITSGSEAGDTLRRSELYFQTVIAGISQKGEGSAGYIRVLVV
jgi:hypothetical protein